MTARKTLCAAALAGILLTTNAAAQGETDVKIETIPVADGIYMLIGRGGNLGVCAGDEGVLLIDDQYAPLAPKIRDAVAAIEDQPIKMVLNTHWHGDHTGGNEPLARTGSLIVAHDNVRVRMSSKHFSKFFNSTREPSPREALPVVTFDSQVTFHVNGHTVRAEHVPPAHTDGDSIVFFEEANVVHMGDTFFNGLYPFVDGDSGGSVIGMVAAVEGVLARIDDETKVIPGHGPLSDRAGLAEFAGMLRTVAGRIGQRIEAGDSLDAVVAAKPTAEYDERWGQGFIKPDDWVGLVYDVMSMNR
ncbi:MAG: MBL fold metallo-hydrolase [Gammaproteobacteria bacterium]|nr:MBL fold metallo-hydrolase [Gammaproteobacteria bacterium]